MRISSSSRRCRHALALVLPVLVLSALVSSCAVRTHSKVPSVTTSVDQPDVPVPNDFRREWSLSYDEFGFRAWKARYVGTKKRHHVENWYRPRMLDEGWVLQSTQVGAKTSLVYFKNADEQVALTFSEEFFPEEDRYNTVVEAEIGPIDLHARRVEEVVPGARIDETAVPASFPPEEEAVTPVPVSNTEDSLETGGLLPRGDR